MTLGTIRIALDDRRIRVEAPPAERPALLAWARAHKAGLLALARERATSGTVALGLNDLAALGPPLPVASLHSHSQNSQNSQNSQHPQSAGDFANIANIANTSPPPRAARHILGVEAAAAARLAADRLRRELPLDLRVQRCTATGLPLEWGDHVHLVRLDSRGQAHPVTPPRQAVDPEALITALRGDLAALMHQEDRDD